MDRDSLRSGGGGVARRSKSQSRGSMQQQQQRKPFGVPAVLLPSTNSSGDAPARLGSSAALFDSCGGGGQSSRVSDAQSALYESIDDDIIYDQGRWRNFVFFHLLLLLGIFYYLCVCVWWIDHLAHFSFFFIPHVHFGPGQQFVTLMLPRNDKDDGPSADARKSK